MPATGRAASGMASIDRLVPELMRKWNIPGTAVAVSVHGRLVFARGYGWADREKGETVQPDSLFRIASLSKPITAVAILKLVEDGKLRLYDKAFRILSHLQPPPGARWTRESTTSPSVIFYSTPGDGTAMRPSTRCSVHKRSRA